MTWEMAERLESDRSQGGECRKRRKPLRYKTMQVQPQVLTTNATEDSAMRCIARAGQACPYERPMRKKRAWLPQKQPSAAEVRTRREPLRYKNAKDVQTNKMPA